MTHAVLIQVTLDSNSDIEHRGAIPDDYVIPAAMALPGFQRGTWMNDGAGTDTCVVVFDTEDRAKSALAPLRPAAGPAVISSGVYEVKMEVADG